MRDIELMADGVIAACRGYVDKCIDHSAKVIGNQLTSFHNKLSELTEMAAALDKRLEQLPAPKDGTSAYQLACLGGFAGSEKEWLESLRGKDAAAIDYERIQDDVSRYAKFFVDQLPKPKDGDHGKDAVLPDIDAIVDERVSKAVSEIPKAKDGESVHPDTVQLMIVKEVDRELSLWSRPKDGEKGKDGADGLGFDDLSVDYDGERTFSLKFQRGEDVKAFAFKIPVIIDRGVYRPEKAYERGDGVTYGGSFHIAQKDAPDGKPGFGGDWRLAVKRGQDGKDGTLQKAEAPQVVRIK